MSGTLGQGSKPQSKYMDIGKIGGGIYRMVECRVKHFQALFVGTTILHNMSVIYLETTIQESTNETLMKRIIELRMYPHYFLVYMANRPGRQLNLRIFIELFV